MHTLEEIWQILETYDSEQHEALISAGTHDGGGVDSNGLRRDHAYTVLKAVTLSNG